ncbi:hypothetical protein CPC08DRAFT_814553 [Agrocybe pediades]|nr:hypothetical protein CPC08DRAFT_814553 [Agrocybe pediades]
MFDNQRNDLPQRNPFLDIEAAVDEREGHEEDDSDEEDHLFLASEEESLDEENGFDHRLFVNSSGFIPERKCTEDDSVWDELLVRGRRRANISKTLQWQVHHDDSPSLDQPDATSSQSTSQVWVRIRPSSGFLKKYKGDIALATSTPDLKEVKYCLVPRLRGKRQLAPERGGQRPVKGAEYSDDGFLIVLASPKIAVSWSGQVLPTKHEYLDFKGSTTLTGQLRKETERRLEQNTQVEVGHRVKFVTGSFYGLTGIVLGIASFTLDIAIPSLDISVEVLPYEIRKEIIPGDRLMVISGDHVGTKGWAMGAAGNIVSIFVRGDSAVDSVHGSDREIDINFMDVTFYEEFQNTNLRDLSSSKSHLTYSEIAEEKRQMRKNPNDIFVGKEVMVTGANEYKGITGIIKDTSLDGQASVALNLFSQPKPVYIPLKLLRLQYTSTFDEGGRRTVLQPLIWDEHAKTAVINRHPLPSLPPPREEIPPPNNPETTPTPAWGPFPNPPAAASHTPALQFTSTWITHQYQP